MSTLHATTFEAVQSALAEVRASAGLRPRPVALEDSLLDDLGLDSLMFVDLTLLIEEHLHLDRLPVEDWIARESRKRDPRFTVRSLVEAIVTVHVD